jgi:hypothetical protein
VARIEGTGEKPKRPLRSRLPKPSFPAPWIVTIALPVVIVAPDTFSRAVVAAVGMCAAFAVGFYEGRADQAREVLLRDFRPNDR